MLFGSAIKLTPIIIVGYCSCTFERYSDCCSVVQRMNGLLENEDLYGNVRRSILCYGGGRERGEYYVNYVSNFHDKNLFEMFVRVISNSIYCACTGRNRHYFICIYLNFKQVDVKLSFSVL